MYAFARRLAWLAAFALPLGETWRRWGALWVQPTAYLDDIVAGIGEFAGALAAAAPSDLRVVVAPDVPELWSLLAPRLASDAVILLKGSRGTRLERLIPFLESAISHQPSAIS